LEAHPEQTPEGGFQNPPVSDYPMQGGYDFVGVEFVPRLWAAGELFKATGDSRYQDAFADLFAEAEGGQAMSWANAYPMALYALLTSDNPDPELWEAVGDVFDRQARAIFNVTRRSGYGVALNDGIEGFEYVWGSNQVALAHGLYLMMADEIFPNENYANAAIAQIHYLFGVNPLAKSYFGGLGANPILEPHHNVSFHFNISVPGFVSEGPNSQGAGGDATLLVLWDAEVPSAMRFTDDWHSWASNEPTIDANATFVALLSYFVR
jgi:endoglucanase